MAFNNLSELRKARGSFENLMSEVEKMNKPESNQRNGDDRIWKPTVDQAGNGYAVIRFLPAPKGEDMPWVRIWDHGFQGPTGKWYIEKSLTTLSQQDPISELNSELWNNGTEAGKEQARKQKRRLSYYSNILVVKDPSNPSNEGKVFLYKFVKKIFDKISDQMQPQFEDETPVNPFDFWEGCNFKLKIRNVEGYRNYDKSEFESAAPLADSDEEIEATWNQQHSLSELIDPSNFKSYDELKSKLEMVLKGGASVSTAAKIAEVDTADNEYLDKITSAASVESNLSDDDDTMSYFSKLAED